MFKFFSGFEKILDFLLPPACLNCRAGIKDQKEMLCGKCRDSILYNNSFFCPQCQARIPEMRPLCHQNRKYILAAATDYQIAAARSLIHYFKYEGFESLARRLSLKMVDYLAKTGADLNGFLIVPVPLHPRKERKRGFNQSRLIAEKIASEMNLEFCDGIKKIKDNKPQAQCVSPEERIENIKDSFAVRNPERVSGRNIILVDDVFTSGATMDEATNVLKMHGAKKIIALVFAKA